MSINQSIFQSDKASAEVRAFFNKLQGQLAGHYALNHPFLLRFSEEKLTREQLQAFAVQHYMYSRFFTRNLAAVISNVPDEHARSLLIMNMYEEIGEPLRMRDRAHLLLLEAGLVQPADIGTACMKVVSAGNRGDIVQVLMDMGVVTRSQVTSAVEHGTQETRDLTHPALFRRFLRSLGLTPESIDRIEPLPETMNIIAEYQRICRNGHWLESMGAMGPGTECVVPVLYSYLHEGIARSGVMPPDAYIFWTIHIHCDEGHGKNIVDAIAPYAESEENQRRIAEGALRVLDARAAWFDGLARLVFGSTTKSSRPIRMN